MSLTKKHLEKPDVNMVKALLMFFLFIVSLQVNESARILAWFPTPSISHQVVFRPLTQELARRGHQITVVTPDPAFSNRQTPENLIEIDVHNISYGAWREMFMNRQSEMGNDIESQVEMIFKAMIATLEAQLNTMEMKSIMNREKEFDLLLLEACAVQALALTHVVKAPVVLVSSFGAVPGQLEALGAPGHPLLYPTSLRKRIYNLSMLEKIHELYSNWKFEKKNVEFVTLMENILKKHFGKDLPPLNELIKNVDLVMLNEHPLWSDNRPVPPGVVYIGGIHQSPQKDLPKDLKMFLDASTHGVIYMSFGTNVDPSVLPPEKIQAFIKAFSKLPYDVLWKWNEDELPGRTPNIRISKWFPQPDLLRHPKVKLFITQGGLQSTDEAINAGVPLIGVPILGDQWYNVEHYVYHRVGLQFDIRTLDEDSLKNAIETVIGDASYRQNMEKLRDLMHDQLTSPLERAVWWTEHVLRHGGGRHLRAPAAFMSWAQFYEIELILTVLGVVTVSLLVGIVAMCCLISLLKRNFKSSAKVKKS